MNHKMVFGTVGKIVVVEAFMLLIPCFVSFYYNEECAWSFLFTVLTAVIVGTVLMALCRTNNDVIYAKEGFTTVTLSWLFLSLIGAMPFVMSGEIPNYVDAVFETVSGFTTTGASILTDVESMSKGLLFWRSLTHWIGGMGVLVFVMAIMPNVSKRSMHIMRAEVPGPVVGKLVPKIRDTAKILYLIYIVMTFIEVIMLYVGGMPFFDSLLHSFGTAGTGGFGIKGDSLASYTSYHQWVITVFMLLFGVNFNIYYLLLIRRFKSILKSTEIWVYFGIVAVAISLIAFNTYPLYNDISDAIKHSAFQVSSIITTTGFATQNFDLWPSFSKAILFCLMLVGACAGSTGGGFKISRFVILMKKISSEIKRLVHPRSVKVVNYEGKRLEEQTITSVCVYLAVYIIFFVLIFLAVSIDRFDFETNFSAVAACFNNIGPGFGAVGPAANYSEFSVFSKIVLSIAMLLGRLEIFPLIIFVMPATWSKTK